MNDTRPSAKTMTGRKLPRWFTAAAVCAATSASLFLAQTVRPSNASAAEAQVGLGTAGTHSVLGGQTVTNTGPTTMSGDLGVSPGTAITGFPPGTFGGTQHAADAAAGKAQADLVTAYNDAAGRAKTASVSGDLVGQTLQAGVYKSTGPLALGGTLTLDAQGDPEAVFIFQIASTLITASSSKVEVINAAQACHVFWQVGSSATLGTTSTFQGTIMALTSITVTTNTTVKGRALARNGAVTLDNNTFTDPACDTTRPGVTTTTTLTSTPTPAVAGSPVTLEADVDTTDGVASTGTVSFTEGATVLGNSPTNSNGKAELVIPAGTETGVRTITANYNGRLKLLPSTSGPQQLRVVAAPRPTASPTTTSATSTATTKTAAPSASATGTSGRATSRAVSSTTPAAPSASSVAAGLASTGSQRLTGVMGAASALLALGIALLALALPRRRGLHRR